MPEMPQQRQRTGRSPVPGKSGALPERRLGPRPTSPDDRFFRHIVDSMRNGVIAFRSDGTLALMNDEAYRIFALERSPGDVGRPYVDVLRERLRERLVSLGEMAAGIAHELKNPLAGIEVMAGLLRRQVPAQSDAQSLLADIISEAKLANAIVVEMLEFVRPVRLQVERTDIAEVLQQSVTLAETKVPRRGVELKVDLEAGLPAIEGDQHQLCQVVTNLLANAFE